MTNEEYRRYIIQKYTGRSAEKPRRNQERLRAKSSTKEPAYEPDDGPMTARQIGAIKKLEPQDRGKFVTSLF